MNGRSAALVAANSNDVANLVRLVAEIRASTLSALPQLVAQLDTAVGEPENANFAELIKASQGLLRLDDLAMSRLLKVSRPTISRWARGVTAPHALGRPSIFASLSKAAQQTQRNLLAC